MLEPAISKIKSLKFATEAAITILRIDDMIKLEKEGGGGNSYQDALRSGQLGWSIYLFIVLFFIVWKVLWKDRFVPSRNPKPLNKVQWSYERCSTIQYLRNA